MGRASLGVRRQVNVRFPPDLIERIDTARGPMSRDAWLIRAAEQLLTPIGQARDPEAVQKVHMHRYTIPVRTEFINGQRQRTVACDCGKESVA